MLAWLFSALTGRLSGEGAGPFEGLCDARHASPDAVYIHRTGMAGENGHTMPGPSLNLELQPINGATIVKLTGDIDAVSIDMFQRAVEPLCRFPQPRVYLDCSGLNYVNSTGFGLLFTLTRACHERNGEFVLCAPRTKVLNVMRVLGLEHLLNVTEKSAMEYARTASGITRE